MDPYRYAFYLIPPYAISRQVAEIHHLLEKQFGLRAAERFQVHATIKGFFKKTPGPMQPLIDALDAVMQAQSAFLVASEALHRDEIGFGLDLSWLAGERNQPLYRFRQQVVDAVRPFIAPDCDFVAADLGVPFHPHITLAFRDIPESSYDLIVNWVRPALPAPEPFEARVFHLLRFHSRQWDGAWWRDLSWQVLRAWELTP